MWGQINGLVIPMLNIPPGRSNGHQFFVHIKFVTVICRDMDFKLVRDRFQGKCFPEQVQTGGGFPCSRHIYPAGIPDVVLVHVPKLGIDRK